MSMARKEMFDAITAAGGTPVTTVPKPLRGVGGAVKGLGKPVALMPFSVRS